MDTILSADNSHWARWSAERRKVRKGTRSCWECKRRKVRCTFVAPGETSCEACTRREKQCISQELPDNRISTRATCTGDEPGRLRGLVPHPATHYDPRNAPSPLTSSLGHILQDGQINSRPLPGADNSPEPLSTSAVPRRWLSRSFSHRQSRGSQSITSTDGELAKPLLQPIYPVTATFSKLYKHHFSQHEEVNRALLELWPQKHDLDVILSTPVDIVSCMHGLICIANLDAQTDEFPSIRDMLELPLPGSHPVLFAQKLLLLGTYLQAASASSLRELGPQGASYRSLMSSAVETAHRLVNCNDELVDSVEALECLAIEGMYYNNAGDLRRAWLTIRRGMLVAQTMGLHQHGSMPSVKRLVRDKPIQLELIWFRLVQSDRYLSLMLSLPQGTADSTPFISTVALEACTPTERLQRIDCAAAGLILERDRQNMMDVATTKHISQLLQEASDSVSPQWWLTPNIQPDPRDRVECLQWGARIMDQLTHYHLVTRLHLPYLLRPAFDPQYESSKMAAVNASREVLVRFVGFRNAHPTKAYCRGIDFVVLIASTILCLAYSNAQHGNQNDDAGRNSFLESFMHQRSSDCGMMDYALDNIERMATKGADSTATNIAGVFRDLLEMEKHTVHGITHRTYTVTRTDGTMKTGCRLENGGKVLQVFIPSFGAINIEGCGITRPDINVFPLCRDQASTVQGRLSASAEDGTILSHLAIPGQVDASTSRVLDTEDCPITRSTNTQSIHISIDPGLETEDLSLQERDQALFDLFIHEVDMEAAHIPRSD